jgi:hypothetical protein
MPKYAKWVKRLENIIFRLGTQQNLCPDAVRLPTLSHVAPGFCTGGLRCEKCWDNALARLREAHQ